MLKFSSAVLAVYVAVFTWANLLPLIDGIQFSVQLRPAQQKCFQENLLQHTLVVVTVTLETSENGQLWITRDTTTIFKETQTGSIKAAFTAPKTETYNFCVTNFGRSSSLADLRIDSGPEARDYSRVARKEHLDGAVVALRRIEDTLRQYHKVLMYMRGREARMTPLHDATVNRMTLFCVLNIGVMVVTTVVHVWLLRRFFRSKKII